MISAGRGRGASPSSAPPPLTRPLIRGVNGRGLRPVRLPELTLYLVDSRPGSLMSGPEIRGRRADTVSC